VANIHRGEVAFEAAGKVWSVRFGINEICDLEEETGRSVVELGAEMSNPATMRVTMLRAMVWAGLRGAHPEVSIKQAGELITEAGTETVIGLVGRAFQAAFPGAEEGAAGAGDDARPPMAGQAGTGSPS